VDAVSGGFVSGRGYERVGELGCEHLGGAGAGDLGAGIICQRPSDAGYLSLPECGEGVGKICKEVGDKWNLCLWGMSIRRPSQIVSQNHLVYLGMVRRWLEYDPEAISFKKSDGANDIAYRMLVPGRSVAFPSGRGTAGDGEHVAEVLGIAMPHF
jgi:hypothetical protein